jgi:heptosyltransferase III
MLSAAVLPALGIGDALLMMIASHQLQNKGYAVTTFHHCLPELSAWFPGHTLQKRPPEKEFLASLAPYDLILVENDNSPRIQELIAICRSRLCIFYPTYSATKHAPLASLDKVFNSNVPMAENIACAVAELIGTSVSKENGLTAPPTLLHRSNKNRVLIHPTSRVPSKNWKASSYLKLANALQSSGLEPLLCTSPQEKTLWDFATSKGCALADTPTLSDLASLVYESGYVIGNDSLIGHLASNLGIPTLIIASDEKRMRLWRPDWLKGELILPPRYLPNWKFLRLKEKHWQHFISLKRVLYAFNNVLKKDTIY